MVCRRFHKGAGPRRGVAAVELAVLLPLLFFLFLAVVDFARVYHYSTTLDDCARAGALYASEVADRRSDLSVDAAARLAALADGASLNPPLTAEQVDVSVAGGTASVTVHYQFRTISNFPGIPSTFDLTRTVHMNIVSPTAN
jgi:Flp pilus assembly protein TadG